MRWRNAKLAVLGTLLAGVSLAFVQGQGVLFPDWSKPTKGTFEAPAAELGKKVRESQPWSITTVASSIEGKTLKGQPVSVVGEVVDLSCYLQVGKHGDKHRDCATKCAKAGQPIGLLTKDGEVFTIMDEEHDPRRDGLTTLRTQLIDHMAQVITVHGTLSVVEGQKALYVQGSAKAQ
jgi:hypothetical protein